MSSIVPVIRANTIYLYEQSSFRNQNNKPDNYKKLIGKINQNNMEIEFNAYYTDKLLNEGKILLDIKEDLAKKLSTNEKIKDFFKNRLINDNLNNRCKLNFDNQEINDNSIIDENYKKEKFKDIDDATIKHFGTVYFLDNICKILGVKDILTDIFKEQANKILTLIYYSIIERDALMYCEKWLRTNHCFYYEKELSSQRISDILSSVTYADRVTFYDRWAALRQENEFLALDFTSISSYSNLIDFIAPGYNREHDKLKQLNLCLLVGETSRLPVYNVQYSGSNNDVSTFIHTLDAFNIINDKKIRLVMDRGFYSKKNINFLLESSSRYDFLIGIPFSNKFLRPFVIGNHDIMDNNNKIICGSDTLFSQKFDIKWVNGLNLNLYVYFNQKVNYHANDHLFERAHTLKSLFESYNIKSKDFKEIKKLLLYNSDELLLPTRNAEINHSYINDKTKHVGWLAILSNIDDSKENIVNIYRNKDLVEKSFEKIKQSLDYRRIRVHTLMAAENKFFIIFISLIILSYIDKVMYDNSLYDKYTLKELLLIFESLYIKIFGGQSRLTPLISEQKKILGLFGIPEPTANL